MRACEGLRCMRRKAFIEPSPQCLSLLPNCPPNRHLVGLPSVKDAALVLPAYAGPLIVGRQKALLPFSTQRSSTAPGRGLRCRVSAVETRRRRPEKAATDFGLLGNCKLQALGSSPGSHPTSTLHSPCEANFPDSGWPAWKQSCTTHGSVGRQHWPPPATSTQL